MTPRRDTLTAARALCRRTNGTSPSLYGLSLGNANAGSNWLAWMSRMGMNYGRLFVATNVDLRGTLGANFGAPHRLTTASFMRSSFSHDIVPSDVRPCTDCACRGGQLTDSDQERKPPLPTTHAGVSSA